MTLQLFPDKIWRLGTLPKPTVDFWHFTECSKVMFFWNKGQKLTAFLETVENISVETLRLNLDFPHLR